jgi:hypothetical protein
MSLECMTLLRASDLRFAVIKGASIGEADAAPLTPCATTTFVSIIEQLSPYLSHLSGDMGRVANAYFRMHVYGRYKQYTKHRIHAYSWSRSACSKTWAPQTPILNKVFDSWVGVTAVTAQYCIEDHDAASGVTQEMWRTMLTLLRLWDHKLTAAGSPKKPF